MPKRTCLAIILAAGEGTRMRSGLPKVLHAVGGLPMLGHVIAAAAAAGATRTAVVVGPEADAVRKLVGRLAPLFCKITTDRRARYHSFGRILLSIIPGFGSVFATAGDTRDCLSRWSRPRL